MVSTECLWLLYHREVKQIVSVNQGPSVYALFPLSPPVPLTATFCLLALQIV